MGGRGGPGDGAGPVTPVGPGPGSVRSKGSHGLHIIGHGGGTQWFFTDMALVPSEQLGIFVSYNSAGGAPLGAWQFTKAVLDRYFPVQAYAGTEPAPGWEDRARAYAGSYRFLRRSCTSFEKLIGTLMSLNVKAGEPGELVISSPMLTERMLELLHMACCVRRGVRRVQTFDRGQAAAFGG